MTGVKHQILSVTLTGVKHQIIYQSLCRFNCALKTKLSICLSFWLGVKNQIIYLSVTVTGIKIQIIDQSLCHFGCVLKTTLSICQSLWLVLKAKWSICPDLFLPAQGLQGPFTRPWQSPVPPLPQSAELVIRYPTDDEEYGMVTVAWRGPRAKVMVELNGVVWLYLWWPLPSPCAWERERTMCVDIDIFYVSALGLPVLQQIWSVFWHVWKVMPFV